MQSKHFPPKRFYKPENEEKTKNEETKKKRLNQNANKRSKKRKIPDK